MKLGEKAKQTFDKVIHVFFEDAKSRLQVFLEYKQLNNGRQSVEDERENIRPIEVWTENSAKRALVRMLPYE